MVKRKVRGGGEEGREVMGEESGYKRGGADANVDLSCFQVEHI